MWYNMEMLANVLIGCIMHAARVGVVLPLLKLKLNYILGELQDGQFVRPSNSSYDQVLESLPLVARYMPVPLLEGILRLRDTWVILYIKESFRQRIKFIQAMFR